MRAVRAATVVVAWVVLLAAAEVLAQTGTSPGVPRLVRFTGTVDATTLAAFRATSGDDREPSAITVPLTFAIYASQEGGAALWREAQDVSVDDGGRYVAALGAVSVDGLPAAVLTGGGSRWLGVTIAGGPERPRILFVSVPYALKAGDADTIGGRPLSAFVMAGDRTGLGDDGLTYFNAQAGAGSAGLPLSSSQPPSAQTMGGAASSSGTANYLGMFTDTANLGNSMLFQTPAGRVGINTTAPGAPVHSIANETPGAFFDVHSGSAGAVLGALPVVYRAARGTMTSPSAVQADDILGGLAVRGYGTTRFSGGRGQVMFKAAENWTDAANGTYLSFATEPLGSSTVASERMRITADGKVGIGTTLPGQALSVAGLVESTLGGFKFPDGTTQATAGFPYMPGHGLYLAMAGFGGTFNVVYGGTGSFDAVAHSDHTHDGAYLPLAGGTLSGALSFPSTTSSTAGILRVNGTTFLHNYGDSTGASLYLGNHAAGAFTASGASNTGIGAFALNGLTTGMQNTSVGASALSGNTVGNQNTGVGYRAYVGGVQGSWNSAFGASAFESGSGSNNTAVGYGAMPQISGDRNTAVGASAGNVWTGSDTTYLGANAGPSVYLSTLNNATAIGANAKVGASNALVLGGTGASAVKVGIGTATPGVELDVVGSASISGTLSAAGPVGIGTPSPAETLHVVGNIRVTGCAKVGAAPTIGTCSSDARFKRDITPFAPMLDRVARLQPVHFGWRVDEFPARHFESGVNSGLIAQDVERVFPELVSRDAQGYRMVNYGELPFLTLEAVRELKAENEALKARLATLEQAVAALQRKRP